MALLVTALVVAGATGQAGAQPPAEPAPPSLPGLPAPADLSGSLLPELQRWIDAVIPAPPIDPVPQPNSPVVSESSAQLAALRLAVLPAAVGDPFFDAWPEGLGELEPGQPIEVRDITATAAAMVLMPFQRALQIKYRTTDSGARPSFATATLVVPLGEWTGPGQRPVVVNNLPINGLGRRCTIGYNLAHGPYEDSVTDYIPPTIQLALLRGYAVLLPDHEGPWMAYAEPVVAGHAILDAIRTVRGLWPEAYGTSRFGMTGYSGGAIATHGAVKQLADYAPELAEFVVGAALGGVPADAEILARSLNGNLAAGVFAGAVFGIARERTEILSRMNHLAQWIATSPVKDLCADGFGATGVLMLPIDVAANFPDPLRSEFAAEIYRTLRMEGRKSATPLYIYNGEQEWWIPAEGARNLFREQCDLGVPAVYRSVFGEHVIAAATGYPEAIVWLDDRLRGLPAPDEC
ncbi:lipase family protein [Nocardia bovistercoris]|uniref:Lipase n=1 Tax=Nocardia bovistercoris TaxID=2785916 RepID=A0A931IEQ7_9NOCA|nr:lipase family protein [Nocardia bovistercoris]MBH0779188.1 lipase [Nocardia bovistercoris]